ncbi:MAG: hypothetical protein IT212_07820 [Bacteroidia bacterium]|nr:hypothetical protein [Bacteroidia bacterium]
MEDKKEIPLDQVLPKEERKPDMIHKGSINYEIKWFGNQAQIVIHDMSYEHRVVIMHQAEEDLRTLIHQMKVNPKGIKDNFTTAEKAGIMKARYMMEKFLVKFLNAVWVRMHKKQQKRR